MHSNNDNSNIIGKKVVLKTVNKIFEKEIVRLKENTSTVKHLRNQLAIVTKTRTIPLIKVHYILPSENSMKCESRKFQLVHCKDKELFYVNGIEKKDFACQTVICDNNDLVKQEDKDSQTDFMHELDMGKFNSTLDLFTADILDYLDDDSNCEMYPTNKPRDSLATKNNCNCNRIKLPEQQVSQSKINMYFCYVKCDTYDEDGYLPIHHAVEANDVKEIKRQAIVLKMKRQTIDIETNNTFLTPLQLAILNKSSVEVIEMLIANNSSLEPQDDDGNSIIHLATAHCSDEALERILFYANNVNFNVNPYNFEGMTPLMVAVASEDLNKINILLRFCADPNIQDKKSGKTALFYALDSNKSEIVRLLLEYGADTSVTNFLGINCRDIVFELESLTTDIQELIKVNSNAKKYIKASNGSIKRPQRKRRR